ncbi:carcinine hydrolase/isopenicillin-N N-acyltransferase family protein [candidate division KSB1 bacterium]
MIRKLLNIRFLILFIVLITLFSSSFAQELEECTIGVASGKATTDGRPMIWKTRDFTSAPNNEIYYNTSGNINFVCVVTANGSPNSDAWMGINEKGFAILNSVSSDLPGSSRTGMGNGGFMRHALANCGTVADFEILLKETDVSGRTTKANFAVLDAIGAVAIYETANNQHWKYDANDPKTAPDGYLVKTNFAFNGGGKGGIERFERTTKLVPGYFKKGELNYKSILRDQMRDFVDKDNNPIELPFKDKWDEKSPYGYISCNLCICRPSSVSAAVMQGVKPGEDPRLSTLWAMLGQPAMSITVPYWPVGPAPEAANGSRTAPLADISNKIKELLFDHVEMAVDPRTQREARTRASRNLIDSFKLRDENGNGLWAEIFPAEDKIFEKAEANLENWRKTGVNTEDMLKTESLLSSSALSALEKAYENLLRTGKK